MTGYHFKLKSLRFRLSLIFISLLISGVLSAQKLITPGYLFNSDPTCREINGRFYLFTTQDPFSVQFERNNEFFAGMYGYHAFSTTDFNTWVDHGCILNTHDAGWHKGTAIWDGDAGIPGNNGKYYAYIPFRMNPDKDQNYGFFEIGVLVADKPEGPYKDALGKPMQTTDGKSLKGLSTYAFRDDNGDPFLLWGSGDWNGHDVFIAKLKPNMVEFADSIRQLKIPNFSKCGGLEYYESPIIFKRNNIWYFTYSAFNECQCPDCNFKNGEPGGMYLQYCTSSSMFGPFDKDPKHFMYPIYFNAHQGICQYKGNWYLAYHTYYESMHRQASVTNLEFNNNGSIKLIYPEKDRGAGTPGLNNLILDAFAAKREAEEFHARFNANDEKGILMDYHFKMRDGGYLKYNQMDFGSGAAGFKVEVSCENLNLTDGKLEFRLDNPYGNLIGEANIYCTKGITNYVVLSGPVSEATGIHDVCLVARGSGGNGDAQLFNVNWFTFTQTYQTEEKPLFGVNCGGQAEDGLLADQAYTKGSCGYEGASDVIKTDEPIYYNCNLPNALKTGRSLMVGKESLHYKFTVPQGKYKIELYFAETRDTIYNANKFDVTINGEKAFSDFDILSAAGGPKRAVMKDFRNVTVKNKPIDIAFLAKNSKATVGAIKVWQQK